MKALLLFVGFIAAGVAVFVGVLFVSARFGGESAGQLTEKARLAEVSGHERAGYGNRDGFRVSYRYEVGGNAYTAEEVVPRFTWEPGDLGVPVCYDPDDPAEHAVLIQKGARCGDESLGGEVQRADEASAAGQRRPGVTPAGGVGPGHSARRPSPARPAAGGPACAAGSARPG